MSIEKVNHKSFVVWDNVGNFAHILDEKGSTIGTYEQCLNYVNSFDEGD